ALMAAAIVLGASFPCFVALLDGFGANMLALSGSPTPSRRLDFLASLIGFVVFSPYVLVFSVNLRWRGLNVAEGRPWSRTLVGNVSAAAILASIAFALGFGFTRDVWIGIDAAIGPPFVVGFWLLPCDLILSAPTVVRRLQTDREWANLQID